MWGILLNREGPNYEVNGQTVNDALTSLYHRAGTLRYWRVVRYCSSLLHHTVDSISPFITTVLVNGKQVSFVLTLTVSFHFLKKICFQTIKAYCWCHRTKRDHFR